MIKSQCIKTAELTSKTPKNEYLSLSALYPEVDKALREAGIHKEKTKLHLKRKKLPKLSTGWTLLREKDIKLAEEKKR